MYHRKRLLSQHFLLNRLHIKQLVEESSISKSDIVFDIGTGKGILTQILAHKAAQVIAIEVDPHLTSQITPKSNIKVITADFLSWPLPQAKFKVFANPPFIHTAQIIHKLTHSKKPPTEVFLILQWEAVQKYLVSQTTKLQGALLYPLWDTKILTHIPSHWFTPIPRVRCVLFKLTLRKKPLVTNIQNYQDLVSYQYIHNPKAKYNHPSVWIKRISNNTSNIYLGSYQQLLKKQSKLQKILRTRLYKHWRTLNKC